MDLLILYFEIKNKEIGAITKSKEVEKIARDVTASLFSSIEASSPKPANERSTPDNKIPTPPRILPDRPLTEIINPSDLARVFF